ncbi:FAD-dependent oxidoreductase [Paraburkholderia sp. Ac-20347]|uniref:FAD-dependent oxidoreductase n=1 Tax=Paraburkholderia sp. Ac-20347 TaxID=2703892 RepID=UPI00197DAAFF|nr:FAD-dependent oxidoreductase [Paraburkholderia sp. Ac-20347]MBN3807607.1 FAD-dependent oxidoreductase [Paraburkholderia sp. Ac-20347]
MAQIGRTLVIGGGIGGMCAAILLRRQGIAVDLVETNPQWAPDGAGITISGPTLRSLRDVGVVDEVLRHGGWWNAIDVCDRDGNIDVTVPVVPAIGAEDLPGGAGIMRSALAGILGKATRNAGVNIRLGLSFEQLDQDESGVDVLFTDGSASRFDLVIGADGIHSAVRRHMMPDFTGSRFTGQGSWRAVMPRYRRNSTIYMGETAKAGMNPISETECYLFVLDRRDNMNFIEPAHWQKELARLLAEFGGVVGQFRDGLLDGSIRHPRILYRPLSSHLIAGPWHRGRIALLGDAVHATTPHLASGAGIAIEGALVLAEELERRPSLEDALAAYADRHRDRASLVVDASCRLGELERERGPRDEYTRVMVEAQQALRAPM